jgi:hypothetical protein
MSVCVYSAFVLFCVEALRRADPPSKESYRLCIKETVAIVRKRNIPTERPPRVSEVSVNLCG